MGKIIQFPPHLTKSRLVRETGRAWGKWRSEYQSRFEAYSEKCRRQKALQESDSKAPPDNILVPIESEEK